MSEHPLIRAVTRYSVTPYNKRAAMTALCRALPGALRDRDTLEGRLRRGWDILSAQEVRTHPGALAPVHYPERTISHFERVLGEYERLCRAIAVAHRIITTEEPS